MHGIGFDLELQDWFDFEIPNTTIKPYYIEDCLTTEQTFKYKTKRKNRLVRLYP